MSKGKIQGNASGTGVLTVTAPNTSTDRTITLPDATGTLLNSDGDGSSLTGVADATKLPLAGGTLTGNLSLTTSGDSKIIVTSGNSGNGQIRFDDAAGTDRGRVHYEHSNDTMLFKVADTNKARLTADGLCFNSDNAAANALDDYEEGTWTPTFAGATMSPGNTVAYYTKIGRQVFFQWYSSTVSISSASGGAEISGLPFTASNATEAYGLFTYVHGTAVDGGSTGGYVGKNSNKMHFIDTNGFSKATYVNGTKYIMISGSYFVA